MQHVSAANGKAVDHGDDRLGQRANLLLDVENVEARHAVGAHVSAPALDVHVASAAEGLVAGAGQDDHVDVGAFAAIVEGVAHLGRGGGCERVAVSRPVDGDAGDAVVDVEQDFGILSDGFPVSCLIHIVEMCWLSG